MYCRLPIVICIVMVINAGFGSRPKNLIRGGTTGEGEDAADAKRGSTRAAAIRLSFRKQFLCSKTIEHLFQNLCSIGYLMIVPPSTSSFGSALRGRVASPVEARRWGADAEKENSSNKSKKKEFSFCPKQLHAERDFFVNLLYIELFKTNILKNSFLKKLWKRDMELFLAGTFFTC